jgi:fatty-acyl-CoA synthase
MSLYKGPTYAELITSSLKRYADRPFVSLGPDELTYGEVESASSQILQVLADRGLARGSGFAVLSGNRPEAFFTVAAGLTLGCRYTMLNPFGSVEQHAFVVEDGEIDTLVFDPRVYEQHAAELLGRASGIKRVLSLGPSSLAAHDLLAAASEYSPCDLNPVPSEDDPAILQYTSGTTGQPKGVILSHRAMAHGVLLIAAQWEWPSDVRFLALTQLAQALLVPVMLRGGTAVLDSGIDPAVILKTIEQEQITATYAVPALVYALLDHPESRAFDTSSLKLMVYASSPISPSRLAEAIERFGPIFMQVYGQTEALFVTMLGRADHDPDQPTRFGSCGRPLAGNEVRVLDVDGQEAQPGEIGEVCIRGRVIMDGYWHQPELTADALRNGWLHTGDLARRDVDGFISIVDRKKDTIVSAGIEIYSREIEDVLASHTDVAAAAVFGVPDDADGEKAMAVVVARPGYDPKPDELRSLVESQKGVSLAAHAIEIVDAMPLTAAGKPDKQALRLSAIESAATS